MVWFCEAVFEMFIFQWGDIPARCFSMIVDKKKRMRTGYRKKDL
jgi:hypothetical protein